MNKKILKSSRYRNIHGIKHVRHRPTVYHKKLRIGQSAPKEPKTKLSKRAAAALTTMAVISAMTAPLGYAHEQS